MVSDDPPKLWQLSKLGEDLPGLFRLGCKKKNRKKERKN